MTLRYYQADLMAEIERQWSYGFKNVAGVMPTGAGKTIISSETINRHKGASCVIAHRSVLVSQLSVSLARRGIRHNLICSAADQRAIAAEHAATLGRVFFDPGARCSVASAQTLARRDNLAPWASTVTKWIVDEGHHLTKGGTWGDCIDRFTHPDCTGLVLTATLGRADGKGLGRGSDGYLDAAVFLTDTPEGRLGVKTVYEGESVTCAPAKVLIAEGYLSKYKVVLVDSHLTEYLGEVAASGDWSQGQLKSAAQKSQIVGDVVKSYLEFAPGKLGFTFTTDVETAGHIAQAYRDAGVPAEVITGETDNAVRRSIMKQFEARKILQIVAVDVVGEGYDVPIMEVVTFARPTASRGLYLQQLGRVLRPSDKAYAIVIDHVGNFLRHQGGPDTPRTWSLDRRDKRAPAVNDSIPIRVCVGWEDEGAGIPCGQQYEKHLDACPYCGAPAPLPGTRGTPEQVEGVMVMLDDETLARLRGEVPPSAEDYLRAQIATGLPTRFAMSNTKKHKDRLGALEELRRAMAAWAGPRHARGESDAEIQRAFWYSFGIDVLTAQTLDRAEADALLTMVSNANKEMGL